MRLTNQEHLYCHCGTTKRLNAYRLLDLVQMISSWVSFTSSSFHPPQSPVKPKSIKDKSKNKKEPALQLLQDAPIRRVLGSVHVPLQSLLRRPQKVDVLCNFGRLRGESEADATPPEPASEPRSPRSIQGGYLCNSSQISAVLHPLLGS